MTVEDKSRSRQKHLWFSAISSFAVVLILIFMVYVDKDVDGLSSIVSAYFVAIFAKEGVSLYTTPKG